jgi:hypothetical protein
MIRRIHAGDATAIRALFETVCREHRIAFSYSATARWCAHISRRRVVVPAPYDDETLAICLHEAAHVVNGECPRTALHFDRQRASSECVECERSAWVTAQKWIPFTERMTARMRRAFRTYRAGTPAPYEALQAADRTLGVVAALTEQMKQERFKSRAATVARWKSELSGRT